MIGRDDRARRRMPAIALARRPNVTDTSKAWLEASAPSALRIDGSGLLPSPRRVVQVVLPPDYYLQYLEALLGSLRDCDYALLDLCERAWLSAFRALSHDARRLAARLLLRIDGMALRSTLQYAEIADAEAALEELAEVGLVARGMAVLSHRSCRACLRRYRLAELRVVAGALNLDTGGRKDELIERLAAHSRCIGLLAEDDPLVLLTERALFERIFVLFFGNAWQDLSRFVISALGVRRYPSYAVDREPPVFASREALDEYLDVLRRPAVEHHTAAQLVRAARRDLKEIAGAPTLPPHRRRVDPTRLRAQFTYDAARRLEQLGRAREAEAIYMRLLEDAGDLRIRSAAFERLGVATRRRRKSSIEGLHAQYRRHLAEAQLDILTAHRVHERADQLGFLPEPRRKLQCASTLHVALQLVDGAGARPRYRLPDGGNATVESAVLAHMRAEGRDGLVAENDLIAFLFVLLCWNVVFAPVPGVFQHAFQTAPLDLGTEDFYPARAELFARRFAELAEQDLAETVARAWDEHEGTSAVWARWDVFTKAELVASAACLGPRLLGIVEFVARHPVRHTRGFPDLLVFDGPLFVEVKGPGDALRLEQRLVHDLLLRAGFAVAIARVNGERQGKKRTRETESPSCGESGQQPQQSD